MSTSSGFLCLFNESFGIFAIITPKNTIKNKNARLSYMLETRKIRFLLSQPFRVCTPQHSRDFTGHI